MRLLSKNITQFKKATMIDALITSKTRIKLLVKFFLNPAMNGYLRELAKEFEESTNSVRIELNRLANAGILDTKQDGNKILYSANHQHPLFKEIQSIVNKFTGLDKIVEHIANNLGDLHKVFLIGDYAKGIDSGIIEIVLMGSVNVEYLKNLVQKAELEINRQIHYYITDESSLEKLNKDNYSILLWSR